MNASRTRTGARPIGLCFHGVGRPARALEPGEAAYWIDAGLLHAMLDLVAEDERVEISFDDSNASDVEIALPALRERGLGATFFVLAGRLGQPGSLGPDEVAALCAEPGMVVGTHGMDHRPWRGLDRTSLDRELVEARTVLEQTTGRVVDQAALPLGRYDRRVLTRLRELGYRRVHCSDRRRGSADAWLSPRFSVRIGDTVEGLRREVLGDPGRRRDLQGRARTALKSLR